MDKVMYKDQIVSRIQNLIDKRCNITLKDEVCGYGEKDTYKQSDTPKDCSEIRFTIFKNSNDKTLIGYITKGEKAVREIEEREKGSTIFKMLKKQLKFKTPTEE